jgi:D-3-phosphoglycerate dehydrogenase / 2-oxoglutarate reductase
LVLSPVHPRALEQLAGRYEVRLGFGNQLQAAPAWSEGDAEVVIVRSGVHLDKPRLAPMRRLRAVVRAGSGTDNLDMDYLASCGVRVVTVPGYHANAVAELTMGLFFGLARKIVLADRLMRAGVWAKRDCVGTELRGKTVGIVGLGAVGRRLAELCQHMGMNVVGIVRRYSLSRRRECLESGIELLLGLGELAGRSDFVSLHVPLSTESHGLVDSRFFRAMKRSAYFVNVARDAVVVEDDLDHALLSGLIAGAGLDVHHSEGALSRFCDRDNVVLTPHLGSATQETQEMIGMEVVRVIDSIEAAASGRTAGPA